MKFTPFTHAAQRMLRRQPAAYQKLMRESVRFFGKKRLTSFDKLKQALPTLKNDLLIGAIRMLPYLNRKRSGPVLLSVVIRSRDALILLETAKTLATLNEKTTTKLLISQFIREIDPEVRYWLAYAISCLANVAACELFATVLQDSHEAVKLRSQVAEGLGYILPSVDRRTMKFKRSLRILIEMLDDPNPEVRFWSIFALANAGAKSAVSKLQELAAGDDAMCPEWWPVCIEAADAICVINGGEWPDRTPKRNV